MKTTLKAILFCLFVANVLSAQTLTPEKFRTKIDFLLKDASTGFQTTLGDFKDSSFMGRNYQCNTAIANFKTCDIFYKKETYYKYAGETEPEMFYFTENFQATEENGKVVKANVELVFDDIATSMGLVKNVIKHKKKVREKLKEVEYLDKRTKRRVLFFQDYFVNGTIFVQIHSDLRPTDLPKYNGCLILYNIQSQRLVSAIALYVYGDGFESEAKLYNNALSKMTGSGASYYGSYEYIPSATARTVEAKLDALGITYSSESINPEGYGLKKI